MAMPETAVHESDRHAPRKHQIGRAGLSGAGGSAAPFGAPCGEPPIQAVCACRGYGSSTRYGTRYPNDLSSSSAQYHLRVEADSLILIGGRGFRVATPPRRVLGAPKHGKLLDHEFRIESVGQIVAQARHCGFCELVAVRGGHRRAIRFGSTARDRPCAYSRFRSACRRPSCAAR